MPIGPNNRITKDQMLVVDEAMGRIDDPILLTRREDVEVRVNLVGLQLEDVAVRQVLALRYSIVGWKNVSFEGEQPFIIVLEAN